MSQPASVIAFKKQVLQPVHVSAYNQLSGAGKSAATVAAAIGVSDATPHLSLLVDEGLAVRDRVGGTVNGATLDSYHLS